MENRENIPEQPDQMETGERPPNSNEQAPVEKQTAPDERQTAERPPDRDERASGERQTRHSGSQPDRNPADELGDSNGGQGGDGLESAGLLPYHEADGYRRRWEQIQGTFVDDPKLCCEQADALVIEVLQRMSQIREQHRGQLRSALDEGGDTEGLRQAMQQYRAFFSGLLRA